MMKAVPSALYLYVPDVDSTYRQAVKDPSGNPWTIATHKEDVSPQEMKKRGEAFFKEQQQKQQKPKAA